MRIALRHLPLLLTAAVVFSACDSVADLSYEERSAAYDAGVHPLRGDAQSQPVRSAASCSCFTLQTLTDAPNVVSATRVIAPAPYLFFDVFNYYGLDMRRTEVRSTLHTPEGSFEEVAAVYITPDNEGLHLICHRQEVVLDPASGDLTYRYETLAPSVEEAEACRQDIAAFVGEREPCQGAACGIPYSKEQLDPDYPPYHDEGFRTPDSVLDAMRQKVEEVSRMIWVPA